jgi:polyhydroxybutyrate depolymerase
MILLYEDRRRRLLWVMSAAGLLIGVAVGALAASPEPQHDPLDGKVQAWKIKDVSREALILSPHKPSQDPVPVILAFHGHGGSMQAFARKACFQRYWPEALVVYMQGLPTPSTRDTEGVRSGWQKEVGDQGDRDLEFFDAVLKTLHERFKVDDRRIYATGHSNGGGFTYLLWQARPKVFAAYAPCAAGFRAGRQSHVPAPIFHIAGEKDVVVSFENQKRTMDAVRAINSCEGQGQPWGAGCTLYPSRKGAPLLTCIHPGGHAYPDQAPELIVKFFRTYSRRP